MLPSLSLFLPLPLIHPPSAIFLIKWSNLDAKVPKMLCLADAPTLDANVDPGCGCGVDIKKRKGSEPDAKNDAKKKEKKVMRQLMMMMMMMMMMLMIRRRRRDKTMQ